MKQLILFLLFPVFLYAQEQEINLDILKAPVSPAASLLDISANSIQKPTDVKGFMATIGNATNSFSALPSNFAIDFAPFLHNVNQIKTTLDTTDNIFSNFKRSFVLSVASKSLDGKTQKDSTQQLALGFRFTLKAGKLSPSNLKKFKAESKQLTGLLSKNMDSLLILSKDYKLFNSIMRSSISTDSIAVAKAGITIIEDSIKNILMNQTESLLLQRELITELSNLMIKRYGFKCDLSGGLMYDFKDRIFDNRKLYKGGVWLTGGWDVEKFSIIGLGRILYNPEKDYTNQYKEEIKSNVWSLDLGVRATIGQNVLKNFDWNAEVLYRQFLNTDIKIENTYRAITNFSYKVYNNTTLTLSLGRDFDKTSFRDGNLVAFLNLITGFGKEKF